jgi:exportin-1
MTAEHEKTFLISVIRDLLRLVEIHSQKNNKAVVASNIMFIVGQYPRFLSGHWRFLKTVVYKLFEFMHELHEGVRDMACDTFLKLSKRCAPSFVVVQDGESRCFVEELANNVRTIISDLEPHQVQAFYEAAGCMVSAFPNEAGKEALCDTLLALPREALDAHVARAAASLDSLRAPDAMRDLGRIFAIYERVARAVGRGFARHAATIFLTVLGIYRTYSDFVSSGAAAMGGMATSMADGAGLQSVRRAVLGFLKAFVRNCGDKKLLMEHFLPRLATPGPAGELCMVDSFGEEAPAARLAELLDLFHAAAIALKADGAPGMAALVPKLLQPAVELVSHNYSDHPEMRHSLYRLTQALGRQCPAALLAMTPPQQKLFLDTLLWGIKHEDPFVAERACLALRDFLKALMEAGGSHTTAFFSAFLVGMLQDVLFVLTDRMHKAQFVLHVELLRGLFAVVNSPAVLTAPIWDQASAPQPAGTTNPVFIFNHVGNLLSRAFPNVDKTKVATFVRGLGAGSAEMAAYRIGVRDFLIESLSFSVSNSQELWRAEQAAKAASEQTRRAAVPGLARPSAQPALGMQPSQAQAATTAAAAGTAATMAALDAIDEDF